MPKIFFGYSDKDQDWFKRIFVHLTPLIEMKFFLWKEPIQSGNAWKQEMARFISQADFAVLLISADFLASDFIVSDEIPRLLQQKGRGLVILPIIIRPCAWQMVGWLARFRVLPRDGQPLANQKDIDQVLLYVAKEIIEIAEVISAAKAFSDRIPSEKISPQATSSRTTMGAPQITARQVFICHDSDDGDFADVLKSELEKAGYEAWIDIDRLPLGEDWRGGIDEAIKSSTSLVVVMTPEAKKSEYVTYEWAYAAGAGVKIVPLMVKPTQLHPRLESLQYLDFTNRRARPWERLINELNMHSNIVGKSTKK